MTFVAAEGLMSFDRNAFDRQTFDRQTFNQQPFGRLPFDQHLTDIRPIQCLFVIDYQSTEAIVLVMCDPSMNKL